MDLKKTIKQIEAILFRIIIFALLLGTFSSQWFTTYYGSNVGFDAIIFYLNMPLRGTSHEFITSYIVRALCPAILVFLLFFFPTKHDYYLAIKTRSKRIRIRLFPFRLPVRLSAAITGLLCFAWFVILLGAMGGISFIRNQIEQSNLIENEYISPEDVEIKFPEQKRNLIWIVIESAESSSQDKANGGVFDVNFTPELTRIAKENVSFSQSDLIEGAAVAPATGWTIAGLVAQTAGLPLKLFSHDDRTVDNALDEYAFFLPGAISLGDILGAQGYHNYFMAGSDFEFGGRTNYFTQHGNYEIFDYYTAIEEGKIPADYYVWWGFEDAKLYSYAKEKLLELASEEEPFNFSLLTVDTHHQDGYLCALCPNTYEDQYANVWVCASSQVDEFVSWIQRQDFYENTTIVISGDHCSMDTDFYEDLTYDKYTGMTVRRVYNAIINPAVSPIQEKNRKFTTMDLFPTALASMGVSIEGNRLGLGTNLFSGEPTLSEKYGYEELFGELNRKSVFYNKNLLYP